ncbi:hypothetical protein OIE13_05710 [Streptosporangium sp. NBC_01810]|uniref:hypothetical protein n=1 Tax=Streptosporangium sp. NBC_01810 TaxID=2975951 RepID=UPI002DDA836A|nr:hypothetical protein [Streptosporangium sp. NBC_01810]WSA27368.1 hypothetical protein OIE13_05710 [Streptosporangium sp. NBC_01810]
MTDLEQLAVDHPEWLFWRGIRFDGTPGDYYANRRRWSPDLHMTEGAALTVCGTTVEELAVQLKEQQRIEEW